MTDPTPASPAAAGAEAAPSAPPGPADGPPPTPLAPVAAGERVEILDVLRGFAIFGILLVNMALFFSPIYLQMIGGVEGGGTYDDLARRAVSFFAQGKFYTLFSFLFGIGLALQMERAAERGRRVSRFFARRMLVLLSIGLAHAFLLWFGDILVTYALLGFVLLLFQSCKPRTLLIWSASLLAVPILLATGFTALAQVARLSPAVAEVMTAQIGEARAELTEATAETLRAYSQGTWSEVAATRAREWLAVNQYAIFFAPNILGLFVLGLWAGRRRVFHDLPAHLPRIRRAFPVLVAVGVVANGGMVFAQDRADPLAANLWFGIQQVCFSIGALALSFAYVAGLSLLWQRSAGRRLLGPLAPVGRMALSNYLMHSVICTTLAYSYGLGLYGEVSHAAGLGLTVLIFVFQIPLSAWWLSRFRFGPMEWLWRSLSYGRMQPMKR